MNNFFNWLIDLLRNSKITELEKENAGIMDMNIMLMERVEELTRENKKLTKENQRLKNELMGAQKENQAPKHFLYDYFIAELEKNLRARGINPEDVLLWHEMKERSEKAGQE